VPAARFSLAFVVLLSLGPATEAASPDHFEARLRVEDPIRLWGDVSGRFPNSEGSVIVTGGPPGDAWTAVGLGPSLRFVLEERRVTRTETSLHEAEFVHPYSNHGAASITAGYSGLARVMIVNDETIVNPDLLVRANGSNGSIAFSSPRSTTSFGLPKSTTCSLMPAPERVLTEDLGAIAPRIDAAVHSSGVSRGPNELVEISAAPRTPNHLAPLSCASTNVLVADPGRVRITNATVTLHGADASGNRHTWHWTLGTIAPTAEPGIHPTERVERSLVIHPSHGFNVGIESTEAVPMLEVQVQLSGFESKGWVQVPRSTGTWSQPGFQKTGELEAFESSGEHTWDLPDPGIILVRGPIAQGTRVAPEPTLSATGSWWLFIGGLAGLVAWKWRHLLAFGLYSRLQEADAFAHPTRKRIRDAIENDPGISVQELARRLEIGRSPALHHLFVLRRHGLVVWKRFNRQSALFLPGQATAAAQEAMALSHRGLARVLLDAIRAHPSSSQRTLVEVTRISQPYVSQLLKELCRHGLVHERREKDGRVYDVAELPTTAARTAATAGVSV
jgi:predicted transcriptional regulator